MVDSVTNQVDFFAEGEDQDGYEGMIHLTNVSDSSGEAAVTKIDISAEMAKRGIITGAIDIMEARWSIQGFTSVQLLWDHSPDIVAMVLAVGSGYDSFRPHGRRDPDNAVDADLLITTVGATSTSTYDITLHVKLRKIT